MSDRGHVELERAVGSIVVGERHRRDAGDLAPLMDSMKRVGLLQPVTITPDGVLMAGTEGAGVIRSTDHGATWNPASGFDNGFVWGLAVMADGSVAAGGQFGDVSVSADNGDSWTRVAVMPNQVFIQAIAIGAGGELFIGSTDSGLYVLPPGGGMVRKVGLGGGITALRVAGGDLIAGTSKGEVHRVVASGGSWTVAASDTLDGRVSSIDVWPGGSLIASTANGIHIAAGGGFDWRRVDLAPLPPAIGSLVVGRDGELYAGTQDGVFGAPSIDGATISFAPMSAGLTGERISSIAPIGGRELVVGTMSSSLYRSTDDGASWSSVMTV